MTVFPCNANLAIPLVLPLYIFLVLEYSFIASFVSSIAPIILCNHGLIYVLTDLLPNCRLYDGPSLLCSSLNFQPLLSCVAYVRHIVAG